MNSMTGQVSVDNFTEEREFNINGLIYSAKMWGPEDGKPVIALHGWLDNANSYDVIAPLLPDLRICSLDLAGHGRSGHRSGWGQYYFLEYAYDVLEVAEQLGWEKFNLMGHSMGAHISLIASATEPEKVEQLMLIEGFGTPHDFAPSLIPDLNRKTFRGIKRLKSKEPPVYPSIDAMVQARANGFFKLSETAASTLVRRSCVRNGDGYTWREDPRLKMMSPVTVTHVQFCEFVKRVEAPTCLILASDGVPHSKEFMDERIQCHKDLRVEHREGGHHLHLEEQGPEVARIVADFFGVSVCKKASLAE